MSLYACQPYLVVEIAAALTARTVSANELFVKSTNSLREESLAFAMQVFYCISGSDCSPILQFYPLVSDCKATVDFYINLVNPLLYFIRWIAYTWILTRSIHPLPIGWKK